MDKLFFMIIAFLAGIGLSIQAGTNSLLGRVLQNPVMASLINFLVGLIPLSILVALLTSDFHRTLAHVPKTKWWMWVGGFLGASLVTMAIFTAPKIGSSRMFALVICGQLLGSLIIDHFGLLGLPQQPINFMRIVGVLFILGGVLIVQNF